MKLQQHRTYNQFFISAASRHLVLFIKEPQQAEVDLEVVFQATFNKKFLLFFFFDEYTDEVLGNSVTTLLAAADQYPKSIWWNEQFTDGIISTESKPALLLIPNAGKLTASFANYSYSGNFFFHTNNNRPVVTVADGKILLASAGNMQFQIDGSVLGFTSAAILLDPSNTGALNFINTVKASVIQPVSPYLVKGGKRNAVHYFDKQHYDAASDIEVHYFPYPRKSVFNTAGTNDFQTRLLVKTKGLKTNLLDNRGKQLVLNSEVAAYLGYTEFKASGITFGPYFHFMPIGGMELTHAGSDKVQLGFNGTESITNRSGNLKLDFVKSTTLLSDGETLTDSLGSCTTKPKLVYEAYNLDAEKMPLFNNAAGHAAAKIVAYGTAVAREVAYESIPLYTSVASAGLPIVPTLSFRDNSGLVELEKVFTKIRIREHTRPVVPGALRMRTSGTRYITPQGFLRNEQVLDFIKPAAKMKSGQAIGFQFSGVGLLSDFNLSLTKEDVFFVLRPSMMQKGEKAYVFFKIREFGVDLNEFNGSPGVGSNDTFIIFKFSRHSFADLLEDPSKWSNTGAYKPTPVDAAKLIENIKNNTRFPTTEDYAYFNDKVSRDPNWNGVVIIKIPLVDRKNLPPIFDGLAASQDLGGKQSKPTPTEGDGSEKLPLQTGLKFQYIAFPINKTEINQGNTVDIASSAFYGVIDYDILNDPDGKLSADYSLVSGHFPAAKPDVKDHRFVLSKLLVRFENSQIKNFKSFAFWQIPDLFENRVEFGNLLLAHPDIKIGDRKDNLIRLEGQYQKNSTGNDEFNFAFSGNVAINFEEDNVLQRIVLKRVGFSYSEGAKAYRFDIDAQADVNSWKLADIISIDKLEFQNIGFSFVLDAKLPILKLDLSRLLVFPQIEFNGNGFLRSFPIRFSAFKGFRFRIKDGAPDFEFVNNDFDFLKFPDFKLPKIDPGTLGTLFSFIFDFDLGTLGNLGLLKALKGQLLVGWTFKGGFATGIKLAGPSSEGLDLDLFGALKVKIEKVDFGKFNPTDTPGAPCSAYYLRLVNARIKIFSLDLPNEDHKFNGIIIVDFASAGKKVAWLINYDEQQSGKLILGLGQRMGPAENTVTATTTREAIEQIKRTFTKPLKDLPDCSITRRDLLFAPDRNYLVASEAILPKDWPIEFAFLFNDPVLYGIYIGFKGDLLKGFSLDILYKKLASDLGVYSAEIQLPDAVRNHELGGMFLRLPNIGADIYTNGDWRIDVGYPRSTNDWSRSGFLQLRTTPPFVGWFGMYIQRSRIASQTLFKGYIPDEYSQSHLNIIQAGFALRVGIGFYFDKGILFVGASITIYGIMEGAFAFERDQGGLASLFPDHFALLGRAGALAELVGYVDFGIIKAGVYISLRAEFGMLIVYLGRDIDSGTIIRKKGIQPLKLYVEGQVIVRVSIKIGCVEIHLSFGAYIRFEFTIGGGGSTRSFISNEMAALQLRSAETLDLPVVIRGIQEIPMAYLPGFSKTQENGQQHLMLAHTFMIPLFGSKKEEGKIVFTATNIFKDKIIKPFFTELIQQLQALNLEKPDSYETLRAVLLTGNAFKIVDGNRSQVKISLSIDGYLPTFINGINATEKDKVDKVLIKHFGFTQEELKPSLPNNDIVHAYAECLMVIPAPISQRMKLVDENNNVLLQKEAQDGFKIRIENLVTVGGAPLVENTITAVRDFDDLTLDWINRFYDDYKSQFVQRNKPQTAAKNEAYKDIRNEVIIPEFFKLVALLTLEAFYSETNANVNPKEGESYNPTIAVDANGCFQFGTPSPWNPNVAIEKIVGQLNYFYNSGLRLPFANNGTATETVYELLKQCAKVEPNRAAAADPDAIKIFFDDKEITKDVFVDRSAKRDMLTFIGMLDGSFKTANLYKEFDAANPIQFIKPFSLVPVTLTVPDAKLEELNNTAQPVTKFFELPRKLTSHVVLNGRYAFELNFASFKDDKLLYSTGRSQGQLLTGMSRCLNVTVKIKRRSDKVLEIANVMAEDVNLLRKLMKENFGVAAIDLFHKHDPAPNDPNANCGIDRLISKAVTVLKTNLSPRTAPPVFEDALTQKNMQAAGTQFWASSDDDRSNFIRLIWEALTTNSGGYYLILDKPVDSGSALGKTDGEQSLILSFEGAATEPTPYYFNALRFSRNPENEGYYEVICKGLKERTHYLYLDQLMLNGNAVKEYHPTMPAHAFGFEITRNRKQNPTFDTPAYAPYVNYLPVEFDLTEKGGTTPILSADKVLPIMPHSQQNIDGSPIENAYIYKHVSPLSTVARSGSADPDNINRYSTVGKTYELRCNLRDTFGFRLGVPGELATAEYTHSYCDKIVPVDAWPLITFSYWFADYVSPDLFFGLSCICDVREILDLAGIPRKVSAPGNPLPVYVPKYDLGQEINVQEDVDKLLKVVPGIVSTLCTVRAQLKDKNTKVYINDVAMPAQQQLWAAKIEDLIVKLRYMINPQSGKFKMPDEQVMATPVLRTKLLQKDPLKNKAGFAITLRREANLLHNANIAEFTAMPGEETAFADLQEDYIWDYDATYAVSTTVKLRNPQNPGESRPSDLNKAIRDASKITPKKLSGKSSEVVRAQFGLGISSDPVSLEKVIYVIQEGQLAKISINEANAAKEINESAYFGIKPFSNRLWSGDYQPFAANAPRASFSNIDLDKSLRLVLAKIDALLQPAAVSAALPTPPAPLPDFFGIYEKLLSGKKFLIAKLKDNIDWVMDDAHKPAPGDALITEFRDLLLNTLSDFYYYDGIAKVTLSGTNVLPKDSRLNVSLLPVDGGYRLYASKIDSYTNEWFLFIDQQEKVDGNINVGVKPLITQIEFDVTKSAQSEIEESQWIQLITPVALEADQYKIKEWTKITREFPEKPVILKHRADQNTTDTSLLRWKVDELGLWNYALEIQDDGRYVQNDNIHVELVIATSSRQANLLDARDIYGFVAYWSAAISSTDSPFSWKNFVADLFALSKSNLLGVPVGGVTPAYSFDLKKNGGRWEKKNVTTGLNVQFPKDGLGQPVDARPDVIIGPFNVFDKTRRVLSVMPRVKVFRNPDVKNEAFIYETETVSPVSAATPHIKYFTPLSLLAAESFEAHVFGTVAQPVIPNELPLKTTAKYLIRTATDFPKNTRNLPVIPVQQIECTAGAKPSATDKLFDVFDAKNGYQAFSLTVYNTETNSDSDLPVFFAETIFKDVPERSGALLRKQEDSGKGAKRNKGPGSAHRVSKKHVS